MELISFRKVDTNNLSCNHLGRDSVYSYVSKEKVDGKICKVILRLENIGPTDEWINPINIEPLTMQLFFARNGMVQIEINTLEISKHISDLKILTF